MFPSEVEGDTEHWCCFLKVSGLADACMCRCIFIVMVIVMYIFAVCCALWLFELFDLRVAMPLVLLHYDCAGQSQKRSIFKGPWENQGG